MTTTNTSNAQRLPSQPPKPEALTASLKDLFTDSKGTKENVTILAKLLENMDRVAASDDVQEVLDNGKLLKHLNFSARLYMLLQDSERAGHDDIISWSPGTYSLIFDMISSVPVRIAILTRVFLSLRWNCF